MAAATKIRFQFKLDGFDRQWVEAGAQRQALYTGLPAGKYQFHVSGSLNGVEQGTATWEFAIRPLFYETWWFYGLCLGTLTSVVVTAWRLKVWFLRRYYAGILEERTRIARTLHDIVLQSMAGAALKLESIAMDTSASAAGELRQLRREIEHHIGEARRSIRALRSPTLKKRTLVNALSDSARNLMQTASASFEMVVVGQPRPCSRDAEEELLRIGEEAIANAVRHACARHLRAEIRYEPDWLRLRIMDDGCGFKPNEDALTAANHWGLRGMQERARRVGGYVRVTSVPAGGTEVEALIPLQTS